MDHWKEDGKVYFLDVSWPVESTEPWSWPVSPEASLKYASTRKGPISQSDPLVERAVSYLFGHTGEEAACRSVLPITPRQQDPRMSAQDTRFTLHPNNAEVTESFCLSLVIPAEAKIGILMELRALGVRLDSLFPELASIAADMSTVRLRMYPDDLQKRPYHSILHDPNNMWVGQEFGLYVAPLKPGETKPPVSPPTPPSPGPPAA
jgi:hypothetical protein